jgi:hypothetical protein
MRFISYSVRMKTAIRVFLALCYSCVPEDREKGWNRTNRTWFSLLSSHSFSENPHNNLFPLPSRLSWSQAVCIKSSAINWNPKLCRILASHSGRYEGFLEYNAVQSAKSRPTFRKNKWHPSSWSWRALVATCFMLICSWFNIPPWRWRRYVSPECRFIFNLRESVI